MSIKSIISVIFIQTVLSTSASAAFPVALPASVPDPVDNISNPDKVALGNALYFDTRLSSDGTIACASCHIPDQGGDDGLSTSPGIGGALGTRNAQSVLNTGFMSAQFWDGREPTLEEQAKQPFINPDEMGLTDHAAVEAIVQGIDAYQPMFDAAFGSVNTPINIDNIVKAIAAFERTLLTPNSPFDQYINGDTGAMTANQIAGMNEFINVNCIQCHADELIARQGAAGTAFFQKFPRFPSNADFIAFDGTYDLTSDLGLGSITGIAADNNRFKVPSLRNVVETAPYFHNGSVNDLAEAIRIMAAGQLNTTLTPTQISQIVDFLGATTGDLPNPTPVVVPDNSPIGIPVLPPVFILLLVIALPFVVRKHLVSHLRS